MTTQLEQCDELFETMTKLDKLSDKLVHLVDQVGVYPHQWVEAQKRAETLLIHLEDMFDGQKHCAQLAAAKEKAEWRY